MNRLFLLVIFLGAYCSPIPPNPILKLEAKIEKEIPYHFNHKTIPLDCTQRDSLFALLYQKDQEVRTQGGDMLAVDQQNFDLLISYIDQCGWPKFSTKQNTLKKRREYQIRSAPFLVLQHSFKEAMANYYFDLKTSVNEGEMELNNLALYQDRLLMYFGLPQVYGTQIRHNKDRIYLYQLWSPEGVNERRKEVQLIPIEAYLERHGIDYEEEVRRQK